ncbi:Cold-regulated 413 inner membrane protein 1 [Citrus sinensis]|uniref:Cold-regulated 413 inner membrane protein 1 n=1 Tax=Citrus sinensis TaxID=2711 RepID=A0ACB8NJ63_CITSI|nr:Cold-regulated 413 inner membrane protein 1 [Citrus sinensis]
MLPFSLSSSPSTRSFSLYNNINQPILTRQTKLFGSRSFSSSWSSFAFNPLRLSVNHEEMKMVTKRNSRGFSAVCYASPLTALREVFTDGYELKLSRVLMLAKGTAVPKSFLVPLFALQAPADVISWIKGEYGIWAAFLALLVRLFFFIPGRGTQQGAIISLVIAGYLAFQHFSRAGNLRKAFEQGSVVATLAIICITALSCLFLI